MVASSVAADASDENNGADANPHVPLFKECCVGDSISCSQLLKEDKTMPEEILLEGASFSPCLG